MKLEELRKSQNITELFNDLDDGKQKLMKICNTLCQGIEVDDRSAESWRSQLKEAMDIAKQVLERKSFPWDGAANIKFPLIAEGAVNFAARVYPEIVPNDDIVSIKVDGQDPTGVKYFRSYCVSSFMSHQLASSPDWKEHIDRLLHVLPVVGTVFTKTYWSSMEKRVCVDLCPPDQIIINHDTTTSLDCARRVTHILSMSINDIISFQRAGLFNDEVKTEFLRSPEQDSQDDDLEVELYECHCWLDLDEDGYKEPYIVTLHKASMQILRIVSRARPSSIKKNDKGEIIKIEAINQFQDYHFIRSPDGGFFSLGFGQFLLPLNKAINSLLNMLLDAGTLSVTQGGFLGKGLRLKGGDMRFRPFEWKVVEGSTGTDLKTQVFPFPVREPSGTLLNLLMMLTDIGKTMISSTEAMKGEGSGTNVAASTMSAMIEQGSTVYKAINKRFYESQTKAFKKIYELNYYHLTDKEYQGVLDIPQDKELPQPKVKEDFNLDNNDIRPVADPLLSSMAQKLQKAQVLMSLRTVDPRAVDFYLLRTLQFSQEEIMSFLPPPDPNAPPPPEAQKLLADAQLSQAKAQEIMVTAGLSQQTAGLNQALLQKQVDFHDAQIQESAARAWGIMKDKAHGDQKLAIAATKMTQQEQLKQLQAEQQRLHNAIQALLKDKEIAVKANDSTMKTAVEMEKIKAMKEEKANDRQQAGNGPERV